MNERPEHPASVPPPGADPVEPLRGSGKAATPSAPAIPLDADDTRGAHLRTLLGGPVTLSLGATLVIGGLVAGTLAAGIGWGSPLPPAPPSSSSRSPS